MTEPRDRPDPIEREHLAACARDIRDARERLLDARRIGVRSTDVRPLRADLLSALERYAAAITQLGAPVPRQLHSEIDLYRRLHNQS